MYIIGYNRYRMVYPVEVPETLCIEQGRVMICDVARSLISPAGSCRKLNAISVDSTIPSPQPYLTVSIPETVLGICVNPLLNYGFCRGKRLVD